VTKETGQAKTAMQPLPVVVMGVTGCGKTVVGQALATRLGAAFVEGDSLHPAENIARMARGEPLTDELRAGWLDTIGKAVSARTGQGQGVVASCSALKRSYRDRLRGFCKDLVFLYLKIDPVTAGARVAARSNHFMPASLVESQFAILEEPGDDEAALTLDATSAVGTLVEIAANRLVRRAP
jgi:gluconokinase